MRTALLTWDYPPWPSGLSVAAREIAEGLAVAGADVTVFCVGRTRPQIDSAITVVNCGLPAGGRLAKLRVWGGVGHLAAPIAFRDAVLAAHAHRPFDIVEATNWYAPGVLLARHRSIALVTRNSTPAAFSRDRPASPRDRFDAFAADRLERRQARLSDGLISNTQDHADRIGAAYGLSAGSMPHAVVGLSLPPKTIERGRRAAYPTLGDDPVRLLFVGRAEHRKGFDALMGAAEILSREAEAGALPPFEVRLAGVEAASLSDLPAVARGRVRALGTLSGDELAAEYETAHAVLAPSRYESFGLVYQEGIAYGRPMVASSEDASARLFVGETGAGSMAAATSGPALADAIRPVLTDDAFRRSLREKAVLAAGRFDRLTLGRETLALYEAALRNRQGR